MASQNRNKKKTFKGMAHPKMYIQSSFTRPHVVPSLSDSFPVYNDFSFFLNHNGCELKPSSFKIDIKVSCKRFLCLICQV